MRQSIDCFKSILIFGIIIAVFGLMSCEHQTYQKELRKNPLHKDNIPERDSCPIDGLWKEAYFKYKYRIEKGRMYWAKEKRMWHGFDLNWPSVSVRDIVRVGPGKYRAKMLGSGNVLNKPCTLSVISREKLVQKSDKKVVGVFYKVRLDNEKWFLSDFNRALQKAALKKKQPVKESQNYSHPEKKRTEKPSVKIHRTSTNPTTVKPGSKFDLLFEYTVNDPSVNDVLIHAQFSYIILEGKRALFKSRPSVIKNENGQRIEKTVHLVGAKKKGVYDIQVALDYKGQLARDSVELIISDRPPVVNQRPQPVAAHTPSASSRRVLPDPGNMIMYRQNYGKCYYFSVTGKPSGYVFGTDIYTDDSELAAASVHAGVLAPGQRGIVKVTILPGRSSYRSSTRHGIKSGSWGRWVSSYSIAPVQ